jgi:hypothetical protein
MSGRNGYMEGGTTVKQKILDALADGNFHTSIELQKCLWDQEAASLPVHICHLRKMLRPQGGDISTMREGGTTYYRLVRLIRKE